MIKLCPILFALGFLLVGCGRSGGERPSSDDRAFAASIADTRNWPRFRGPRGDGSSQERGLPVEWSDAENIVWRTPLPGPGSSSPITWNDRIYLTCYSGYGIDKDSPGNKSQLTRHLVCLQRDSGEILWDKTMPAKDHEPKFADSVQEHGYASSTPAADASSVFVFYGPSGAAAYSHSGELKWAASCGTESHFYGSGSSPVLYGNLVVVQAEREGHAVIALNKNTGQEVWRQSIGDSGFSTPALVEVEGRYELVCGFDQGRVCGLEPASGELLWECQVLDDFINPTAVAQQGIVYILGRGRSAAVRAGGRGDVTRSHIVWQLPRGSYVPSAVLHAGHLYWSNEHRGVVYCAEAAAGKMVYEKRLKPTPRDTFASPILADGKIYYVTREGGAYVLAAQPEFQQLAHNVIETDQSGFNASPAVSRGQILLRSNTHLYCIGLPLPPTDAAQPAEGSGASAEPDDPS